MIQYVDFYKKFGARKMMDFITPKIIKDTDMVFPNKSMLFWYIPSKAPIGPSKEYGYLTNLKNPVVQTIIEYHGETIGSYRLDSKVRPTVLVKDLRKENTGFKYLAPNMKKFQINNNTLMIVNLGIVEALYRYMPNMINRYYEWYNMHSTAIEIILNKNTPTIRHKFITIKLPLVMPLRLDLERFVNHAMNLMVLGKFTTYEDLTILDLWKLLSPKYRSTSIFNRIPESEMNNIDLIFNVDNKVMVVNMGMLMSIVKDYEIESKLPKYSDVTSRKILYIMLSRFINGHAKNVAEINNNNEQTPDVLNNAMNNLIGSTPDLDTDDEIVDDEHDNVISIKKQETVSHKEETGIKKQPVINVNDILDNELTKTVLVKTTADDIEDISDDETIEDIVNNITETEDVTSALSNDESEYKDMKDLLEENIDTSAVIVNDIEKLKESKLIPKSRSDKLKDIVNKQKTAKINIPGKGDVKLASLLTVTKEETELTHKDTAIPKLVTSTNPVVNKTVIKALDSKYIKETYHKDIASVIYSVQNTGIVVDEYTVTKVDNIMGGYEEHSFKFIPINGNPVNIKILLPNLSEDGEFTISGNKYRMRKQKTEIPIRKLDFNNVVLSSYYGKLFVTKATYKKDDIGFWVRKQLIEKYSEGKVKNLVLMSVENMDVILPTNYSQISRYVKSYTVGNRNYYFEYSTRNKILNEKTDDLLKKVEKNGHILVGVEVKGNVKKPIVIGEDNRLWEYSDGRYKELGSLYEEADIDISKGPIEYANIKIYKKYIPLVIILSYYIGLSQLMKLLKTKYREAESNKRVDLKDDEYSIRFKDKKIIATKDGHLSDIILGGLKSMEDITKEVSFDTFNRQDMFNLIFHMLELPSLYVNKIKVIKDMFVDPITKSLLEELKEPTTFQGLLVRSGELLTDDNYKNPNNIEGSVIKGYERISGMMYNEMVSAIEDNMNKNMYGKSNISINPYRLLARINEDSTTVLVDDLNPIAQLKQSEDLSLLGSGGRSKVGVNRAARAIDESEIGIVSEATKDSGDVGTTMYLSATPNIISTRGLVKKYDKKEDGLGTVLSTTSLLLPAANRDDVKRSNFANIQASHVVPIMNAKVSPVRTGYESVFSYKVSDKFVISAKNDGEVLNVTDKYVEIVYKDTKREKIPLKTWTSKEESNTTYTHKMITNLKKGDKIKTGDTLVYDSLFFEPDMFDKTKVIYKSSVMMNVALFEDIQTFEDSCAISSKASNKLSTVVTKVKSIVVTNKDDITELVKVGQKLDPNDVLLTITDPYVAKFSGLTADALEALKRLKNSSPKSKYKGTVSNIVVYYNSEYDDLSSSIKQIVDVSDKNIQNNTGVKSYTGKVNNTYSIQGKPLLEGNVEIKIYIDIVEGMGVGDKAIFSNQLKTTVGEVFDYDMSAEDGTEIEAIFGAKSIAARIVLSPYIIGTTSKVLELVSDNACKMYFEE